MATQNFSTIGKTKLLSDTDKILIGKQDGDFSTELKNVKDYIDPGKNLLIFYSTPLSINNAWSVDAAAIEYSFYDYIVFGNNLEESSNPENANLIAVISRLKEIKPDVRIFGYVDAGVTTSNLTLFQIETKINNWQSCGATDIFLDDMGFDYGLGRSRQNDIISLAHSYNMFAMINSWNPDDVFSNEVEDPTTTELAIDSTVIKGDLYLSESFIFNNSNSSTYSSNAGFVTQSNFKSKEDKIIQYVKDLGIIPCACDIVNTNTEANFEFLVKYLPVVAATMSKKVYGIQSPEYSASDGVTFDKNIGYNISSETYNFKKIVSNVYTKSLSYRLDGSWIKFYRTQNSYSIGFCLSDQMMSELLMAAPPYEYFVYTDKYLNLSTVLNVPQQGM